MHATIQKPIEEIVSYLAPDEKVFVIGCGNCAMKCHSGGPAETEAMAERLKRRGVEVIAQTVPGPAGMSLCKLSNTKKHLAEEFGPQAAEADSFLVLSCGQGVHTVIGRHRRRQRPPRLRHRFRRRDDHRHRDRRVLFSVRSVHRRVHRWAVPSDPLFQTAPQRPLRRGGKR